MCLDLVLERYSSHACFRFVLYAKIKEVKANAVHTSTESKLTVLCQSDGVGVRVNTAHGDGRVCPAPVPGN